MMKTDQHSSAHPNFSSLTEIMEHFRKVPYEQFQQELKEWFTRNVMEQGKNERDLAQLDIPNVSELINNIYHKAELLNLLSDSEIKPENEGIQV